MTILARFAAAGFDAFLIGEHLMNERRSGAAREIVAGAARDLRAGMRRARPK